MRWSLFIALICLFAAAGCSSGGGKTSDKSADELLKTSAEKFAAVKTFHFALDHENGSTALPLGLRLIEADGDIVMPDRLAADVKAKLASTNVSVKVIGIDNESWMTNPFSRDWQRLPSGFSIWEATDPAAFVNTVARSIKDPKVVGTESVGGVNCQKISGKLDSAALRTAFRSAAPGTTLDVDVWVGN